MAHTLRELEELYRLPLWDLLWQAQKLRQAHPRHPPVQRCCLINVRQGGCPEDCAYCAQSVRYEPGRQTQPLMDSKELLSYAQKAKETGAHRLCLGAAWRGLSERDSRLQAACRLVETVAPLGLEICTTFGLLTQGAARELARAGVGFYNHNLNTGPRFYPKITTTHSFEDRLRTIQAVQEAGMAICSGGILGMGETAGDRLELLATLASLPSPPESIPWNILVPISGTPLAQAKSPSLWEVVRILAVTRIAFPKARVRLSAGRQSLSKEAQVLCFVAGADSIFFGEKLLTVPNLPEKEDRELLEELGLWENGPLGLGTARQMMDKNG
jgi:biotin synthase